MKKLSKMLILAIILFVSYTPLVFARVTIKETLDSSDGFSTIERNTTIIGVTKFSSNEVITASKATTAGSNDAMLYVEEKGTTKGYKAPVIYVYYGPVGGWYALDENNKAVAVVEEEKLKELSNLEIYYVNNVEKELTIDYDGPEIDISKLEEGVEYKDNKLIVKATTKKIKIPTTDGRNITYKVSDTTSSLVKDDTECYTINNGYVTSYKDTCDSDVVIPTTINNTNIVGIADEAFYNKSITSVVIPKEIKSIGNNAFASNNLKSVVINEKYSKDDFELFGENAFGEFSNIKYNNDITRVLDLIPDSFEINIYKELDTSVLEDFSGFTYQYLLKNSIKLIEENGYDVTNNDSLISDYTNRLTLDVRDLWNGNPYEIGIHKWISDGETISEKKEITINYNTDFSGIEEEYDSVLQSVDNIEENQFLKEHPNFGGELAVGKSNLLKLEDIYNVEFYYEASNCYDIDNADYSVYWSEGFLYLFKNNTLYYILDSVGSFDTYIVETEFIFKKTIFKDYADEADLVNKIIDNFKSKIGVNDYILLNNEDGSSYSVQDMGAKKIYTVKLLDVDSQTYWNVIYYEYYADKYDTNNKTLESCFDISNGVITSYDGSCGANPVIPDTINGQIVTEIGSNVFDSYGINTIDLPDTITKIGYRAFSYNNLEEIKLPENLVEIGESAFDNNLIKSVEFNSKLEKINRYAFNFNKLVEIELPDTVTIIGDRAFYKNNLTNVVLSDNLVDIGSCAFFENKLIEVELPDNLIKIGDSAFGRNKITNIKFNEKLEHIGYSAFSYNKIKKLILPDSIKTINGSAFSDNEIEELLLSNKLENIEHGVFANNNIKSLIIPNNIKYISEIAFRNNDIASLEIGDDVEYIAGGAFNNNKLSGDDAFIYDRYSETSYVGDTVVKTIKINKEKVISYGGIEKDVVIPDNITIIGSEAFSNCELNSVEIPNSVDTLERNAFAYNNLTEIAIPKSVINFGDYVFGENKFKDKYLYYTEEDGSVDYTSLVAYVGNNYYEDIIIPENIRIIKEYAFTNGQGKLSYIPDNIEVIEDFAFGYYLNIDKTLTLPKNLKYVGVDIFGRDSSYLSKEEKFVYARNEDGSIDKTVLMAYIGYINDYFCDNNGCFMDEDFIFEVPEQVVEIRENVFNTKLAVSTVELNSNLKKIGDDAFSCNYQLKNIHFNEGLEEIGDSSFRENGSIKTIVLPSTVKKVGNSAFEFNSNLTKLTLNEGLEEVGDDAFGYNQLTEIDIPSTVKKIGTNSFGYNIQKVRIHGKSSLDEFESIGDNPFGFNIYDDNIEYINE